MKVSDLFPQCARRDCLDKGVHRHILPGQQALLDSKEKFVALVGGYGCVAAETLIGEIPIAEFSGGSLPTLFGPAGSSPSFLKLNGAHTGLYRVSTQSGKQVVATLDHQVLTPTGWCQLRYLDLGKLIAVGGESHEHFDPGEQLCSLAHCSLCSRPSGAGLLPSEVVYQGRLRQLRKLVYENSAWLVYSLLSIVGSLDPIYFENLVSPSRITKHVGSSLYLPQEQLQFLCKLLLQETWVLQCLDSILPVDDNIWGYQHHVQGKVLTSSYPPMYQGWDRIVKLKYIREGQFYDLSVPSEQHYLSQGIYHHNSGKTLAVSVLGHLLSTSIPGNMGIIVRRSLPKLHDSALRIYLEVLQRSGVGFKARDLRDGWPHRLIYANGSEVSFRETKDLGRFLGPEYGWFDISEAQEEPEKTFKDLSGRLRLPRATRYLKGMLDTNPPSNQHWIAKIFPKAGAWTKETKLHDGRIVKTSFRMLQSSTYDNPFLSPDYVAGLLLLHTPAEAKRIISGNYGFTAEGEPVYPIFDFLKHVGDPPIRRMTLYRVWDWGYHGPAVSFGQIFRCTKGQAHVLILHEVMRHDMETEAFAPIVLEEQAHMFPQIPASLVVDGADAAGASIGEKGPGPILRLSRPREDGGYNLHFTYQKFPDIDPGLDKIRLLLRSKCQCGYYLLMIHRRCTELIQAMAGGYHYPKERPGKEKGRKPVKDGYYDNIADTVRYLVMLFYDRAAIIDDIGMDDAYGQSSSDNPFAWMGSW